MQQKIKIRNQYSLTEIQIEIELKKEKAENP